MFPTDEDDEQHRGGGGNNELGRSMTRSLFSSSSLPSAVTTTTKPYLVGIAGGTASGKTSLAKLVVSQLEKRSVLLLSLDSFYRPLTESEKQQLASGEGINFDVPSAFDMPLLKSTLEALVHRQETVRVPVYDFVKSDRVDWEDVRPADIIIIEGILVLYWRELRELMSLQLFVDTEADTRLARRIVRDTRERGRSLESVLLQYEKFVKPAHRTYIAPTMEYADIIIPRGSANTVAVGLIVEHMKNRIALSRTKSTADLSEQTIVGERMFE